MKIRIYFFLCDNLFQDNHTFLIAKNISLTLQHVDILHVDKLFQDNHITETSPY